MNTLIVLMAFVLSLFSATLFADGFVRDSNFEKKLDNLFSNKSENQGEIGEFLKLSLCNDEVIIETKVDIINYKRQIQTAISEIMARNNFEKPSDNDCVEINESWKMIHKCSELEDRIWILIKSRRLWEEKERKSKFAEKSPHQPLN